MDSIEDKGDAGWKNIKEQIAGSLKDELAGPMGKTKSCQL